jgi:hypothetical protein
MVLYCIYHIECFNSLCFQTAVVALGDEELHLVAMTSRRNLTNHACFWGYKLPFGLYNSCLTMLNLRCLGIVFDLDETLVVANTSRSFEDRIDALQRKLSNETDPQRRNGMLSEIKRYQDDKSILKQYIEGDQVYDDGKVYKAQPEIVPPLSDNQQTMTRPVIRLQEKDIILTRINPLVCAKLLELALGLSMVSFLYWDIDMLCYNYALCRCFLFGLPLHTSTLRECHKVEVPGVLEQSKSSKIQGCRSAYNQGCPPTT